MYGQLPALTGMSGFGPGNAGPQSAYSLQFDGTNYVDCGNVTAINGATEFTLAFWSKRAAPSEVGGAVGRFDSSASRADVVLFSDGLCYLVVSDGAALAFGTFASNDTNWHHFALVFDGAQTGNANRLKGYLDGVQQSLSFTGTIPAASQNMTASFRIGDDGAGRLTLGKIDDVLLCSAALTGGQIANLAAGAIDPASLSPAGLWRFEEGTGTTAADSGSGGHNGTLVNGPLWSTDVPAQLQ